MPDALRPTVLRIAAWCSITALGLLAMQHLVELPLALFVALVASVVASSGFLTARSYAHHYRFARLRIGRALATSLSTALLVGTVGTIVAAISLLWWTQTHAAEVPVQQFFAAGAAAFGLCVVLAEVGALAAAVLFTWRARLHSLA